MLACSYVSDRNGVGTADCGGGYRTDDGGVRGRAVRRVVQSAPAVRGPSVEARGGRLDRDRRHGRADRRLGKRDRRRGDHRHRAQARVHRAPAVAPAEDGQGGRRRLQQEPRYRRAHARDDRTWTCTWTWSRGRRSRGATTTSASRGVAVALVGAVWLGAWPFVLLPEFAWTVAIVVAFAFSAITHKYYTAEMKVGEPDEPPELT